MPRARKPRSGPGSRTGANARSGPSIPESERASKLLSIRLSPEARARLDAAAEVWGSRSAAVVAGLDALDKAKSPRVTGVK